MSHNVIWEKIMEADDGSIITVKSIPQGTREREDGTQETKMLRMRRGRTVVTTYFSTYEWIQAKQELFGA